jgi:tRNA(fMet)-specific endonuclease VapC
MGRPCPRILCKTGSSPPLRGESSFDAAIHADTNICVYVLKNRAEHLREKFNRLAGQLCISTISLAELLYGVEKSSRPNENRQAVEQFVARLDVLPFSASAASHYGQIRVVVEGEGGPIGAHDMLIGAHAAVKG